MRSLAQIKARQIRRQIRYRQDSTLSFFGNALRAVLDLDPLYNDGFDHSVATEKQKSANRRRNNGGKLSTHS